MSTFTSREFNQDVGRAKRLARDEPVFVTDRGRPSHVLMTYETYRRLSGDTPGIIDLLAMSDEAAEADFDAPRVTETWDRAGDVS